MILKLILLAILPAVSLSESEIQSNNTFLSRKKITLTTDNTMIIKGPIDKELSTSFIYNLNKKKNKNNLYVYLDTPGGSVEYGSKIVDEIKKYKLNCIAERAYSMGFVILQACNIRYITPYGKIMQHQMSYGLQNEKAKVESYVDFVDQFENELTEMQASRIGISEEKFTQKTYNDWWIVGRKAIIENCADKLAEVTCSVKLTNENYTETDGVNEYTYSRCPLVTGYISKKQLEREKFPFIFYVEN